MFCELSDIFIKYIKWVLDTTTDGSIKILFSQGIEFLLYIQLDRWITWTKMFAK